MKVIYEREREPYLILKGGSWNNTPQFCRAAYRLFFDPGFRVNNLGLRPLIRIKRLG